MAHFMPPPLILIVSPAADFADSLAEQVKTELGFACEIAADFSRAPEAAVLVTTETAPEALPCPVVAVRERPVRMPALLADIAQAAQGEDVALGGGYRLKIRPRQLQRGTDCVDLTDKEVALIQCLSAAGAEGMAREQLLKAIWGFDSSLDTHTLETHIYRLRAKLRALAHEGEDALIAATPGGYAMV